MSFASTRLKPIVSHNRNFFFPREIGYHRARRVQASTPVDTFAAGLSARRLTTELFPKSVTPNNTTSYIRLRMTLVCCAHSGLAMVILCQESAPNNVLHKRVGSNKVGIDKWQVAYRNNIMATSRKAEQLFVDRKGETRLTRLMSPDPFPCFVSTRHLILIR